MPPQEDKTVRRDIRDLLKESSSLKANFVVLAGADIGRKYEIKKSELIIGRNETNDIFINDEDVSRNHAKVEVLEAGIILTDLGSTNGTLVNGARITKHQLIDGDRIQIGNVTVLKFNFLDNLEDTFNEQLYNSANKDFLTGLYNKKYFLDRLRMEISFSRRHDVPLSLVIFDIDLFKRINDTYGHHAGDHILRELANQISTIKRQEDLFARFGGEEFVLLLRDANKDSAVQIAEKIRTKVESIDFTYEDKRIPVTISLGLGTFFQNNYKNPDTFFRAADIQLYRAKKTGRNRTCFGKEGVSDATISEIESLN